MWAVSQWERELICIAKLLMFELEFWTFLRMWLSGIVAITNSNDDSEFSRICLSGSLPLISCFFLAVNSTPLVSIIFWINIVNLSGILYILRQCNIQFYGTISSYYFTPREIFFYNSIRWWSFIGTWVTARLRRPPEQFWVFCLIVI